MDIVGKVGGGGQFTPNSSENDESSDDFKQKNHR